MRSTIGLLISVLTFLSIVIILNASSLQIEKDKFIGSERRWDLLKTVINDKELSKAESLKREQSLTTSVKSTKSANKPNLQAKKLKHQLGSSFRSDTLRQELFKESKDNCLAQLICANEPPKPHPTNGTTELLNDYAYLIKEFFDIFYDPDEEIKKSNAKKKKKGEKDKADEESQEDEDEDNARSDVEKQFVNITGSISTEDVVPTTTTTIRPVTASTTTTTTTPHPTTKHNSNKIRATPTPKKITIVEFVGDSEQTKDGGRESKTLISFDKLNKSQYINRKIREMRYAPSSSQKLRIARKIASKLREPRQCREFANVASEVLSTCPLTTEVIRYFNTNLKNSSQLAILKQNPKAKEGGIVVLNNQNGVPHPYFLDNSPIVANTNIQTDLKNPSVGDRFPIDDIRHPIYEHAYPQLFDTKLVSLTTPKPKDKQVEEDEDEDNSNSEEQDDEVEEDDAEDEEEPSEDEEDVSQERSGGIGIRVVTRNNQKYKHVKTPKKKIPKKPQPTLPPGIIKVYGQAQPSFDNEFSLVSTQIGTGSLHLFEEDEDLPLKSKAKSPPKSQLKRRPIKAAPPTQEDEEEEDEEEEEEDDKDGGKLEGRRGSPPQRPQHPHPPNSPSFPSPILHYNSFPAPAPQEYYHRGRSPRPRPPTPNEIYSTPGRTHQIRGRLNFAHSPNSGLLRPYDFRRRPHPFQ